MARRLVTLLAIISIAIYLVPAGAHVFELANKMALPPDAYMTVQKIYAGWALFGIVIAIALAATLAQTLLMRAHRTAFLLSLLAFFGLAATQVVFWTFTYPMNAVTQFWTVMPEPFEAARRQWEYSHAAGAALTFLSLIAIVLAALLYRDRAARLGT